ncbi:hypothetical protein U9M48_021272 [Paspalum notatum var. saurae]|uniref:GDSL esterase/lipase n=1 Tax=Paspalum notatum var. saurae TaxID=547442 RepID=A0AAQ3WTF2_PASNO
MSMRRRHLPSYAALLLLLAFAAAHGSPVSCSRRRYYGSIFSFGDSFADTGNKPVAFALYSVPVTVMRAPYGMTFFGHPTGRTTDGRVILDLVAEALGLPLVPPSLAHNGSFRQGANFAVAGATALDAELYHSRGIPSGSSKLPINTSLDVQLEWFQALKPSLCGTPQECDEFFSRSLFFVGEFGVNDYHLSLKKLSVQQVRSLVPDVVRTIAAAVERLILRHGATSLVVPGVIPSGCSPPILTQFAGRAGAADYDPSTGCLREVNELGEHHNSLLQDALQELRAKHPRASILYADFFRPIMKMVESPREFGFREDVLTVCCGGPGRYNYNDSVACGDREATPCNDPSGSLYWDGVHLTEAGYGHVADGWLSSIQSSARDASSGTCKATEGLALPYVPPYLGPPFASPAPADSGRFRQGASLAVGAATALDVRFFRERGIPGAHSKSLFLVGEFGVNDYHLSFQTRSVGQVRSYVPRVVSAISTAVERLIHLGARALVVPGVIPSGCSPPILAMFSDAGPAEYDPRTGCLKAHNELGRYHNALLQPAASLQELRARYPRVSIVYADFFEIVMDMVESPHKFGQYPHVCLCLAYHILIISCMYAYAGFREDVRSERVLRRPREEPLQRHRFLRLSAGDHLPPTHRRPSTGTAASTMADLLPGAAAVVSSLLLLVLLLLSSTSELVAAGAPSLELELELGGARARWRYDSIFAFGNSYTDTGNNPEVFAWYDIFNPVMRPPYGSTFFGHPTGRNCDGRLIIDFIAANLSLPFVAPSLVQDGDFRRGANFAVGGATALDASFFHPDGEPPATGGAQFPLNTSLGVQLQWFESLKPSLCRTPTACKKFFGRSLFYVGELGFNDFNFAMGGGMSLQQIRSFVPYAISNISMAIERLIVKHGAKSFLVSGMVPAGCVPPILAMFGDMGNLDPDTGCMEEMNEMSIYHDSLLRESLQKIRARHPDVDIFFADFFNPVMEMVKSPAKFGFEEDVLTLCCGGPGKYHFSIVAFCGDPGATSCPDPSARLFWDGAHLTEAANKIIADGWLSAMNSPPASASI